MTPYLHPRSRLTTSLFGTTLLVSFVVVGLPHILPCPAPRIRFADAELEVDANGRRKGRPQSEGTEDATELGSAGVSKTQPVILEGEKATMRKMAHECPVPKPGGIVGRVFGFKESSARDAVSKGRETPSRIEIKERE